MDPTESGSAAQPEAGPEDEPAHVEPDVRTPRPPDDAYTPEHGWHPV